MRRRLRPGLRAAQRLRPLRFRILPPVLALMVSPAFSAEQRLAEALVIEDKVIAVYSHDLALARARQVMLTDPNARGFSLLEMPAGKLTNIKVADSPDYTAVVFPAPGGRLAYCNNAIANNEDCYVSRPGGEPRRIDKPGNRAPGDPSPILSSDGDWLAWVELDMKVKALFIQGKGSYRPCAVRLRSLKTREEKRILLPGIMAQKEGGPGLPLLLSLDMQGGEFTFFSNDDRAGNDPLFTAVRLDGTVSWGPFRPKGLSPDARTFIRVGKGWVAWNAFLPVGEASQPSRKLLKWSLAGADGVCRPGSYRLGRAEFLASIRDVAVSPGGKFIAISVAAGNRLLKLSGSIRVIRVEDGTELFRAKTLAGLSGDIAFLGDEYFAYSKYDDPPERHRTHVLRLPKEP